MYFNVILSQKLLLVFCHIMMNELGKIASHKYFLLAMLLYVALLYLHYIFKSFYKYFSLSKYNYFDVFLDTLFKLY